MLPLNFKARFLPLSIRHYAFAFFLIIGVFITFIAILMRYEIQSLNEETSIKNKKSAQQEISETITKLSSDFHKYAIAASKWDELRQQFYDPSYYRYWRNSRALTAGVFPDNIEIVELYNTQGESFTNDLKGEASMPLKITKADLGLTLKKDALHDHLYYFFPVWSDEDHQILLGYAGFKIDFHAQIQNLKKFRFLDINSISLASPPNYRLLETEIASRLKYSLIFDETNNQLEKIMSTTLYRVISVIILTSIIAYFFVNYFLAKPLRQISKNIDSTHDEHGQILQISSHDRFSVAELEKVRKSLNEYQKNLNAMHLSLEDSHNELWTLAHHDPLTSVYNRRAFEDDWYEQLKNSGASQKQATFLLFDCDHFKAINDTYGHQIGDLVIQGIAKTLQAALRTGDRLYRLGGDEFATLLFNTDIAAAEKIAQRCFAFIAEYDFTELGIHEPVKISIGMAYNKDVSVDDLTVLHKQADLAMYHAKRPGQKNISIYSEEMSKSHESVVSNKETHAVYEAIASIDMLQMHYQIIARLPNENCDYYEALVRIQNKGILIMPSGIFPVVERRRLEVEFDLAILERIRRDLENKVIPSGTGVSMNVSGPGIVNEDVTKKLLEFEPFFKEYKLVLEVTETALITQITYASANLNKLRKIGFLIALDDFGSGYSSLRYLSNMPVDLIKFDISMIRSLEQNDRQSIIVENLAKLLISAGYNLVAEGIETKSLLDKVIALGFTHAQGYYLGRPQAFEHTTKLLTKNG